MTEPKSKANPSVSERMRALEREALENDRAAAAAVNATTDRRITVYVMPASPLNKFCVDVWRQADEQGNGASQLPSV